MDERVETGRTLEALRRKNLEGKKTFVEELRRQRTPQAVSLLLEILCDESWFLRELAIVALAEVGATAIPPLRRLLATGLWYTRAAASQALGRLGDTPSAGPILILLTDSNVAVHDAAVKALKSLAAAGGAAAIREALAALPTDQRTPRLEILSRIAPELVRGSGEPADAADSVEPGSGGSFAGHSPSGSSSMGSTALAGSSPGLDSPRVSDDRHASGGSPDPT